MIGLLLDFLPHAIGLLALVGGFFGLRMKWKRDGARDERVKQKDADNERASEIRNRVDRAGLPDELRKYDDAGWRD